MADLIDAYVSRLRFRLLRRLPRAVVDDHVKEIAGHLRESVADRIRSGMPEHQASTEALRSIGCDRLVADSLIRARTGIDRRTTWSLCRIAGPILLLYGVIPLSFFYLEPVPEWLMNETNWLPSLFVITFGYSCWRSRKLLIGPMAAIAALVCVAVLTEALAFGPMGYTSMSRQARAHTIAGFDRNIGQFEEEIEFARSRSWTKGFPSCLRSGEYFLAPKPQTVVDERYISGVPIATSSSRSTQPMLMPCATRQEAEGFWKRYGATFAPIIEQSLREAKSNQAFWRAAWMTPHELGLVVWRTASIYGLILGVVVAINIWILAMEAAYRTLVARLWRPSRLVLPRR
ncbi:MAG: permease prefix domain 1-containing protein [Fimbriimonas sp.]|nr:permease prefix domain 1-containing protein [Fimbriimonas sp.]